jgi:hypothetical protein
VYLLLLASKMFLLVDPDVADILAAVGVPGLHSHASFPNTDGFPILLKVSLLLLVSLFLVSLFLLTLPCCPHFVGVVRYYYRLAAVYVSGTCCSGIAGIPAVSGFLLLLVFTMMLAPSF